MNRSAVMTTVAVLGVAAVVGGGAWGWLKWRAMKKEAVDTFGKIARDARGQMNDAPVLAPTPAIAAAIKAIEKRGGKATPFSDGSASAKIVFPPDRRIVDADLELLDPFREWNLFLTLAGTGLTDVGLQRLAGMEKITELDLAGTDISAKGLAHLVALGQLIKLNLSRTRPGLEGLAHVKDMRILMELDLSGCSLAPEAQAELKAIRVSTLRLKAADIGDEGLRAVAEMAALERLDLEGCPRITDEGVKALAGLSGLRSLNLAGTAAGDAGVKELANIKQLTFLDLSRTRVTPAGLAAMRNAMPDTDILPDAADTRRK